MADGYRKTEAALRLRFIAGAVVIAATVLLLLLGIAYLSARVKDRQTEWLAQSVRRSAIQCYVIEGAFPTTEQGVDYLRDNYGLSLDSRRYIVYYESMGDNLLPHIRVLVVPESPFLDKISEALGTADGAFDGADR